MPAVTATTAATCVCFLYLYTWFVAWVHWADRAAALVATVSNAAWLALARGVPWARLGRLTGGALVATRAAVGTWVARARAYYYE